MTKTESWIRFRFDISGWFFSRGLSKILRYLPFLSIFSDFYLAVSAFVNDANHRKPNLFSTPMTQDMGQNMLPAIKTENFFVADFSDFYLAVSASVNDANHRKPNSFITPMTRDIGQNMLLALKTENFLSPILLIFIWL